MIFYVFKYLKARKFAASSAHPKAKSVSASGMLCFLTPDKGVLLLNFATSFQCAQLNKDEHWACINTNLLPSTCALALALSPIHCPQLQIPSAAHVTEPNHL